MTTAGTLETVSENCSHGGVQGVYRHASASTGTQMSFSVFVPPHEDGAKLPAALHESYVTLLVNLRTYRPYLPQNCLPDECGGEGDAAEEDGLVMLVGQGSYIGT